MLPVISRDTPRYMSLVAALIVALAGCGDETADQSAQEPARLEPEPKPRPPTREDALLARVAQDEADVDAYLALGNLYYDSDRPHRAIPAYQEVLKHRPDDPNVRTDLGTRYKRLDKLDEARQQYELVLQKHPKHLGATYNLAVVTELAGDRRRAAELWERAAALAPPRLGGRESRTTACGRGPTRAELRGKHGDPPPLRGGGTA